VAVPWRVAVVAVPAGWAVPTRKGGTVAHGCPHWGARVVTVNSGPVGDRTSPVRFSARLNVYRLQLSAQPWLGGPHALAAERSRVGSVGGAHRLSHYPAHGTAEAAARRCAGAGGLRTANAAAAPSGCRPSRRQPFLHGRVGARWQ
jgi:hypothetical protein